MREEEKGGREGVREEERGEERGCERGKKGGGEEGVREEERVGEIARSETRAGNSRQVHVGERAGDRKRERETSARVLELQMAVLPRSSLQTNMNSTFHLFHSLHCQVWIYHCSYCLPCKEGESARPSS